MSITKDTLQKHLTDPAVFCCRRAKGTVIGADDLEDPTLFDDMVDAGLLKMSWIKSMPSPSRPKHRQNRSKPRQLHRPPRQPHRRERFT